MSFQRLHVLGAGSAPKQERHGQQECKSLRENGKIARARPMVSLRGLGLGSDGDATPVRPTSGLGAYGSMECKVRRPAGKFCKLRRCESPLPTGARRRM